MDIPEAASFKNVAKPKRLADIDHKINKIIGELAKPNDLAGVIDVADFNNDEKLEKGIGKVSRLPEEPLTG